MIRKLCLFVLLTMPSALFADDVSNIADDVSNIADDVSNIADDASNIAVYASNIADDASNIADDASNIADALGGAWPGMVDNVTIVDWDGKVLRKGSNGYTCMPTAPAKGKAAPMCLDSEWQRWAEAWAAKKDYSAKTIGISYMLGGDAGASNVDPYALDETKDNEWIREGAHLMLVAPPGMLDAFPTDPDNGGPYVMWKGTPYAHLMIPIGSRD